MKIPEEDLERKRRALQHMYGRKPMSWIALTLAVSIGVLIGNLIFAVIFLTYLNTSEDYDLPRSLQNPIHHRAR